MKIPFIAAPYPDELVYSIAARFQNRVRYPRPIMVFQDLFGTEEAIAAFTPSCQLEYFTKALLCGNYTVRGISNKHTLMPFYRPFLSPEQVYLLYKYVESSQTTRTHKNLRVNVNHICMPRWFRFCPICVEDDRRQFGEGFWHRSHQIPGVEVCPIHMVFLEESCVRLSGFSHSKPFELVSAEEAIQVTQIRLLNLYNSYHVFLLDIAKDAMWLLSQQNIYLNLDCLHEQYFRVLNQKNLTTETGRICKAKLAVFFRKKHFAEVLHYCFQTKFGEQGHLAWIIKLLSSRKAEYHPIFHIILMRFLEYSVEAFFKSFELPHPFGEAPWPCLNSASDHFQKYQIDEFYIDHLGRNGRLKGTFYCSCGFVYSRMGPDIFVEDRFRIGKVESYGRVWESVFEELWNDPKVKHSDIERLLNIGPGTIRLQSDRLRLFPKPRTSGSIDTL